MIFHEGDPASVMHLIDIGHVAVKLTTPMGEIGLIDVFQPGDTFGEQSLVDGVGVRTATTVAVGRVETLSLDYRNLCELRDHHPDVDRFLLMLVGERLRAASQRLLEALYLPAETRVLRCVDRMQQMFAYGVRRQRRFRSRRTTSPRWPGSPDRRPTECFVKRSRQVCSHISRAHIDVSDVSGVRRKAGLRS